MTTTRHERVLLYYDESPTIVGAVRLYLAPTLVTHMVRRAGGKKEHRRHWGRYQDTWFFCVHTPGRAEQLIDIYCDNYRVEMLEGELYESLRSIRRASDKDVMGRKIFRKSMDRLRKAVDNLDRDCPSYNLFHPDGNEEPRNVLGDWLRGFTWSPEVREKTADMAIATLEEDYERAAHFRDRIRDLRFPKEEPAPVLRSYGSGISGLFKYLTGKLCPKSWFSDQEAA